MKSRLRTSILQFSVALALALSSTAHAEPGSIGGLPKLGRRVAAISLVTTTQSPDGELLLSFSGPRKLSVQEQQRSGPYRPDICAGCRVAPPKANAQDSESAVDLSGFSVRVEEVEDDAVATAESLPHVVRFRANVLAGSSVRYVFEGRSTEAQLLLQTGDAELSLEDCAGNLIVEPAEKENVLVVDAVTSSKIAGCRVLRVDGRSDSTFVLTTSNYR
jgi:hypothetical protein